MLQSVTMPTNTLEVAQEVTTELGLIWNPHLETIIGFCAATAGFDGFPKIGKRSFDPSNEEAMRAYLKIYVSRYFVEIDTQLILKPASTTADPAIDVILKAFAGIDDTATVSTQHRQAMAAENLLGSLLERYLASMLEPHGWVWCAGNTVRSVDFLSSDLRVALQVKNRDNSENSSSSAIRRGTTINKWFRIYSASGRTNWAQFPAQVTGIQPSEEGFYAYIQAYALRR